MNEEKEKNQNYGCIYMCISPSGKKYIGRHKSSNVDRRINVHYWHYLKFLKKKIILELKKKFHPEEDISLTPKGFCTALCNAFQKYGFNSFKWKIIKSDVPLESLNDEEDKSIIYYNTLTPNGLNLILNKKHNVSNYTISDETKSKLSKIAKNTFHKHRKYHEQLEGMPQHVMFVSFGNVCGYRIVNHPFCKLRQFIRNKKTVDLLKLKQEVIDFLKKIDINPYVERSNIKRDNGIPEGIIELKEGKFLVQLRFQKRRFCKSFGYNSREENLKNAIECMNEQKEKIKSQGFLTENVRPEKKLPKGIYETKNGLIRVNFCLNKQKYYYSSRDGSTREENIENAIIWMKNKKEEIKNADKI
jgi:hypothetical protein